MTTLPLTSKVQLPQEDKKCILCDKLSNKIDYACIKCNEYVCTSCNVEFKQLNSMLKMCQFKEFEKQIEQHDRQSKILKLV